MNTTRVGVVVDTCGSSSSQDQQPKPLQRRLGANECFAYNVHVQDSQNIVIGLTLLTKHAIDEGLMKVSLQEFQHMFPQLTSCISSRHTSHHQCHETNAVKSDYHDLFFTPMECPTLPLDTTFNCKDMFRLKYDTDKGPLWSVQLINEISMDLANLGFGPEISALLEDATAPQSMRWRNFLRYQQGKVNQEGIANYDDEVEGHRSFILFSFHPVITDVYGSFHLMKHFLTILDAKLEEDASTGNDLTMPLPHPHQEQQMHLPIESLLQQETDGENFKVFNLIGLIPKAKSLVTDYIMPYKSLLEGYYQQHSIVEASGQDGKTSILRGWLSQVETRELISMIEEDDCSLHAVILAASLLAVTRTFEFEGVLTHTRTGTVNIRSANVINMRQYNTSHAPRHGCLTTHYVSDYTVPWDIDERLQFWRFAHELTVKHNAEKGAGDPLHMMRAWNQQYPRNKCEMSLACYGDMDRLFLRKQSGGKSNLHLEDIFHCMAPSMGIPFTHSCHVTHGRLNYILAYNTLDIRDQRIAFMIRDETINILRMSVECAL